MNKVFSKSILAAAFLAGSLPLAMAGDANVAPIGELTVSGNAQLFSGGAAEAVSVRNAGFEWFSGDRVVVRGGESRAVLALNDDNSFGFGAGADVRLARDADGALVVELEAGTFLYAIDEDQAMTVSSGDYVFSTLSDQPRAMLVSRGDSATATGLIERTADGDLRVSVHQGNLLARHASGELQYQVVSGEAVSFDAAEPRMVQVQAMAARAQDDDCEDDDDCGLAFWLRNNAVPIGLTAVVGGVLFERTFIADRTSRQPSRPVSP